MPLAGGAPDPAAVSRRRGAAETVWHEN